MKREEKFSQIRNLNEEKEKFSRLFFSLIIVYKQIVWIFFFAFSSSLFGVYKKVEKMDIKI